VKILVVQTAFLGDVILATAVLEKLHQFYPDAKIDFVLREGNEQVLQNHPFVNTVFIWNKKEKKYSNLFSVIRNIRKEKYNYIINLQRYAAAGLITALGGGKHTIGFNKNPLSFLFEKKFPHLISADGPEHETDRNQKLIADLTDPLSALPKLYPSDADYRKTAVYKSHSYICIAPASVWFTKQFPVEKWKELIAKIISTTDHYIYLLGSPADKILCSELAEGSLHRIKNAAGEFTVLQTAALMEDAVMNYVNDSAPMHIASSMNAPVTAIYCSTVPGFGFGPLSEKSVIVETKVDLPCRPCGIRGWGKCPLGHFRCATTISIEEIVRS
jgi:ADP-heptose:LPS heptosyltransferase